MELRAPKGTKDILPPESEIWQYMEDKARYIFDKSNYKEIRTPIFEATELFARGVGTSTDIVNKEMYTFIQKERSLTLRPENTAGVSRAYIEHGMHKLPAPVKLWYKGPMFRYERPQAGRQRQFHQVGVEVFGIANASADAEVIQLAMWYLEELGISNLSLEINNIGCPKCRDEHKENIKEAVKEILPEFCEDCQVRFVRNPLRMLDCKNEECKDILHSEVIDEIIKADYVCDECSEHFSELQEYLKALNIDYKVNKLLVRGLDYYNRTVFEITSTNLGAQNAVCGGGRYDPLVEMIGGQYTPAVGWAMGMERLMSLMPSIEPKKIHLFIVSNNTKEALKLAEELRKKGIITEFDMANRKFGKQLEKASKSGAQFALILGEDELNTGTITVKNLETGEQEKLEKELALQKINLFYNL
ncbi:MAG: histidine--tRNA ligase [Candidatus Melainabacteria bacterium RIFOXYA12_FULL_32_12]|nr:MAG: histidine--tRNA ligase [Candidatus Melainabacteria bacterium GWF2_32_7]OGI17084.1 MAG: histidine--tRNA ligase [Candidatus Melainabacteria bacterium RIFOXYA2_FULL_32_9]OGI29435.1 MAG: histidine--tRNA ligase [Candidatus Melainabacteria bacterium RIFOXYA12_FULL_32_12]